MSKSVKPRSARGTRDFLPEDMRLRNTIIAQVTKHFKLHDFDQIETPAVENLETLTGKYGEEGDQLIFKILNSGDFLKDVDAESLAKMDAKTLTPMISEKALRYDLTVPFARFVTMHRNDLSFPFRRYQIQPVWRADRPAKGRYREFYQCDADVIGSDSLYVEIDFIQLINEVFNELGIKVQLRLNNRKVLYGYCETIGIEAQFTEFTVLLDKLDKKSWTELTADFKALGLSDEQVTRTKQFIDVSGKIDQASDLQSLKELMKDSEQGLKGVGELEFIVQNTPMEDLKNLYLDLSLARGLNYYTGAIVEVVAENEDMGSLCGGGRYDDLTGVFGMDGVSGMGISFGIDRIYDILKAKDEQSDVTAQKILFANFGSESAAYSLKVVDSMRKSGIPASLYPDEAKMKKQFKYADQSGVSHMIVAGPEEMEKGVFQVKSLKSGSQEEMTLEQMIKLFSRD